MIIRRHALSRRTGRAGFSLVELLVVTLLIAMLTGLILPQLFRSLRQARATVCKANLRQLYQSLEMYRGTNEGWLPVMGDPALRSATSWATKLYETQPAARASMICPTDPWASMMRRQLYSREYLELASYGMNDFVISSSNSFLANLDRHQPLRPSDTILLADMGPDVSTSANQPAGGSDGPAGYQHPSRNGGLLEVDDGYRPGVSMDSQGESWLTPRHDGFINVVCISGEIKSVNTQPALQRNIVEFYARCAAQFCTLCVGLDLPHYSFEESHSFWWTGPVPAP